MSEGPLGKHPSWHKNTKAILRPIPRSLQSRVLQQDKAPQISGIYSIHLDLNMSYSFGAAEQKHAVRIQFIFSRRTSFFSRGRQWLNCALRAATPHSHRSRKQLDQTVYTYNKV